MIQQPLQGARFVFAHGAEIWIADDGQCVLIPPAGSDEPTHHCSVDALYAALYVEAYLRGLIDAEALAHACC